MGILQIFSDFANWSTVCGVPHIANAQSKISRIFWSVVFVCMVGVFSYQLYIMIDKYFKYPASVTTTIKFAEQNFPVVTVCNFNPYKYSVVSTDPNFGPIKLLMDDYKAAVAKTLAAGDSYGLKEVENQTYDRDSRAADALILLAAQLSEDQKKSATYSFNDLIAECSYSGKHCNEISFTSFIDPVYGACYSFNENNVGNYTTTRAGMKFGLKLLVTVTQETIDGQPDFLPTTRLAGARVGINSAGAQPALESNGINVGVGYQTAVSITMSRTERLKKPYGDCVDTEDKATNNYSNKTYSLETCFNGCRQRETVKRCGCANPRYAKSIGESYCTASGTAVKCLQGLKGDQSNKTNPNMNSLNDCGCKAPCNETSFLTTSSLAKYPSSKYYVANAKGAKIPSCDGTSGQWSRSDCHDWYSNNALLLQVFFESLKYEIYSEEASYGMSAVLNDLGGQAGLWLGLSVISVIEVCGLLVLLFLFCFTGGKVKIQPTDDDMDNDHRIKDIEGMKSELDHIERSDSVRKRNPYEKEDGKY